MKISSSNMIMQSSRRYTSSWSATQRFQFNKGLQDADTKEMKEWEEPEASQTYDSLKNYFDNLRITHLEVRQDTSSVFEQFRQQTIRSIFAMLFGEEKAKEIFDNANIIEDNEIEFVRGVGNFPTPLICLRNVIIVKQVLV